MGIRAPKQYDQNREPNFDAWLACAVFHMSVSNISNDKRTSSLLLLFDTDSFEVVRHLGIHDNTDFDTAKEKLKAYFGITETPKELNEKLGFRPQEAGETIQLLARDIKLIGHRVYTKQTLSFWKTMIHVFIRGLRDEQFRERVLLK